jgi:hypothetical protein
MSRVPNQPIVCEVKSLMQSQAKFDDSQIRSKMRTSAAYQVAEHLTHLGRQPFELRQRKIPQIMR